MLRLSLKVPEARMSLEAQDKKLSVLPLLLFYLHFISAFFVVVVVVMLIFIYFSPKPTSRLLHLLTRPRCEDLFVILLMRYCSGINSFHQFTYRKVYWLYCRLFHSSLAP